MALAPLVIRLGRSLHRSFAAPQSVGFGAFLGQRLLNSACWAGRGDLFGDHILEGQNENGSLLGASLDDVSSSSPPPFGTVDAEITPETIDFFVSDAEGDPDCPSEGYSSIEQALNTLRQGKVANLIHVHSNSISGIVDCKE